MLQNAITDPAWAQAAVAALVALFTLGTLVAVAITARLQRLDRKDRISLDEPEVEISLCRQLENQDWCKAKVLLRNFGMTTITAENLATIKPKGVLLLSMQDAYKYDETRGSENKLVLSGGKSVIRYYFDIAPLGARRNSPHEPPDVVRADFYMFAPSRLSGQECRLRLTCWRKRRADRLMSIPIRITIPAAITKAAD